MVEVKANIAVTSVTVTLSTQEAGLLRKLLQETILWQENGPVGTLAQDIDESLDDLDIPVSPIVLTFSEAHGMYVEKVPA